MNEKRKKLEPLDYLKWFGIFLLGAGSMFFDHQQAESNRALVEEISNIEVFKIQFSGTKTKLVTLEKKDETLEKLIRELVAETRKIIKEASKDRLYKSDYLEYKQGVEKDIDYLKEEVSQLRLSLKDNHVRREEFEPIKKIVYGVVSVLMMGVVGALLAIVIK